MPKTPKLDNLEKDIDAIFEYTYLPKLVKRELMSFIVKHRIDEMTDMRAKENDHGALMIMRNDGVRDVSNNERRAQLWQVVETIGDEEL